MKSFSDDDLIALLFGEAEEPEILAAAVAASPELRARLEQLRTTLELAKREADVPARDEHYGAQVWRRLEVKLHADSAVPSIVDAADRFASSAAGPARWVGLAAAAAAVVILGVGFVFGRLTLAPEQLESQPVEIDSASVLTLSDRGRQRILVATLSDHLRRSERLLTEVANASNTPRPDPVLEQQWAAELLRANRLYRRAAEQAGQVRVAHLLAELEPVFLELAHSALVADQAESDAEWRDLQRRIDDHGLLFKVRVTGGRLGNPPPTGEV